MSLQSLLESANNFKAVSSDAARLSEKWEKTGLLEGLEGSHKSNMVLSLRTKQNNLLLKLLLQIQVVQLSQLVMVHNGQELLFHL